MRRAEAMKTTGRVAVAVLGLAVAGGIPVRAQAPGPSPTGPAALPGAAASPLFGGVPEGTATSEELALSLPDALQRALARNLGAVEAVQSVRLAESARNKVRADLLPNLTGHVAETRQKINLAAFGFTGFPGLGDFPDIVGPFNVFDARVGVTQSVFDLHALEAVRAEAQNVRAAKDAYENTRDLVVLVTGNLYIRAAAAARLQQAAQAEEEAAERLYRLAADRKQAGVVAGIEVLRAQVDLQRRKERALAAANQVAKAKLDLARAIGLPLGQRFALTDIMTFSAPPPLTFEQALARAYDARADLKESRHRVAAALAARRAARGEALPSVGVSADYGAIGNSPSDAKATYTLGAAVRVPLFEGGRVAARVLAADAALEQRRAEEAELRARIRYEVEGAYLDLSSGAARVEAARAAVSLADEQLRQAEDRFRAGVAGNIEVVQAQDALAAAHEAEIGAVYDHNVAKASLARSLGIAEEAFAQFLRGQ